MQNLSLKEFNNELSAKKPVPGGGGAAALAGALAASLSSMVVNYTLGKKRYAAYNDRLEAAIKKSIVLRDEMLGLIQQDADAFKPLSKAYSLPTDTEEQKQHKDDVMEKALYDAAMPPLKMARKACEIIDLHAELLEIGSKIVVSDVGVGVTMAKSALKSAMLNVFINTGSMKDRPAADKLNVEINALNQKYTSLADEVYDKVLGRISK